MKNYNTNTTFQFQVHKKHISKNKTLRSSILYDQVELSANQSISQYKDLINSTPKSFDLNFMKNAYLNDQLIVRNHIQKLDNAELELCVTVLKKQQKHHDIICKAIFGYALKNAS